MSGRSGTSSHPRSIRDSSRPTRSRAAADSASPRRLGELDRVILTEDLPEYSLAAGDVGTVVDVYADGEGYEVEFCSLTGKTIAIATVESCQVRAVSASDVSHSRRAAERQGLRGSMRSNGTGHVPQREKLLNAIMETVGDQPMTVTGIMKTLEKKGLLPRVAEPRKRIAALLAEESGECGRFRRVRRGEYARRR